MGYFDHNPNTFTQYNFIEIPEGNHRVLICNVRVKNYRNEKKCFEIVLKVSGHHGKLWYYLWYNPEYPERTNRNFGMFFESFQIYDYDIKNYKKWIGKEGAVHIRHDYDVLKQTCTTNVVCCLNSAKRDTLPPWKEGPTDMCYDFFKTSGQIF